VSELNKNAVSNFTLTLIIPDPSYSSYSSYSVIYISNLKI